MKGVFSAQNSELTASFLPALWTCRPSASGLSLCPHVGVCVTDPSSAVGCFYSLITRLSLYLWFLAVWLWPGCIWFAFHLSCSRFADPFEFLSWSFHWIWEIFGLLFFHMLFYASFLASKCTYVIPLDIVHRLLQLFFSLSIFLYIHQIDQFLLIHFQIHWYL